MTNEIVNSGDVELPVVPESDFLADVFISCGSSTIEEIRAAAVYYRLEARKYKAQVDRLIDSLGGNND